MSLDKPWSGIGIGGSLALDFTNTLDWRLRAEPEEGLRSFPDLLRWGWSAGVLDRPGAQELEAWVAGRPAEAARALVQAIEVREAVAALFGAVWREEGLPAAALATLESSCRSAGAARVLRTRNPGVEWSWREGTPEPERVAWAVALDAARLLTGEECARIRQCGDFECGWFFLDTSRNRSRRWCTMKSCGNRNKARSFYRRSAAKANGRS